MHGMIKIFSDEIEKGAIDRQFADPKPLSSGVDTGEDKISNQGKELLRFYAMSGQGHAIANSLRLPTSMEVTHLQNLQ